VRIPCSRIAWRNVISVRIAQISDCFAPRTGGIETQVATLSARQVAAGHDVQVITATPTDAEVALIGRPPGYAIHRLSARIPFELPIHPRTTKVVADTLAANPVDVVHVHVGVVSPFAWGAIRAALQMDIPVVVTVHSVWGGVARPSYAAVGTWSPWRDRRLLISAVSSTAAARVSRSLPSAGPIRVIPNGIDESVWAPERTDAFQGVSGGEALEAISVMRMAPRKRTLPLVRIVEEALDRGVDMHLTLVGDGPERSSAERYVQRNDLEAAIRFTGRRTGEEIRQLYRTSDLFIQPSVHESFGIAALEARTAGLPVLARAQSGTVDFIRDGREGVIVDDDAGMSRALALLSGDRGVLSRMSQHNALTPPAEVWSRVLGIVDEAYASAIAGEHLGSSS
jgi:glycosyltransferase involved in cell wall biosynthesis